MRRLGVQTGEAGSRPTALDVYGPWSVKAGQPHVAPPFALLADMVTLRVHLDPVGPGNSPLLIAPGSHRLGRVAEPDIDGAVEHCGTLSASPRQATSGCT